ncbi:MAG: biopolymer transporter ExbD [Planctomycetes bacterium]|nr:biopolymer transporter ExbD [Planctomycetota bacterium]MBI3845090.1 biopolymer transporter ExbD [Planctomycetota bacterium]
MAKFQPPPVEESVSPNLIPMIDIMFLLLLFFMLGADMSQRELEEVTLPQADMVQADSNTQTGDLTTVNVHHRTDHGFKCAVADGGGVCRDESHWLMAIRGKDYTRDTLNMQLQVEATLSVEPVADPKTGKQLSARMVMIRADQNAPYGLVQKVIEACSFANIYKIQVGAAKPPKA